MTTNERYTFSEGLYAVIQSTYGEYALSFQFPSCLDSSSKCSSTGVSGTDA